MITMPSRSQRLLRSRVCAHDHMTEVPPAQPNSILSVGEPLNEHIAPDSDGNEAKTEVYCTVLHGTEHKPAEPAPEGVDLIAGSA